MSFNVKMDYVIKTKLQKSISSKLPKDSLAYVMMVNVAILLHGVSLYYFYLWLLSLKVWHALSLYFHVFIYCILLYFICIHFFLLLGLIRPGPVWLVGLL
jgi:hypothetical protein